MSKKFGIIALLLIVFGAIIGGLFGRLPGRSAAGNAVTAERISENYKEALDVIDSNYVTPIDHEKISESSIQGMLYTLDPHSTFFSRAEFKKLYEDQSSRFYGIGVSILQHRDGVYVQSVVPNTPADKAGLRDNHRRKGNMNSQNKNKQALAGIKTLIATASVAATIVVGSMLPSNGPVSAAGTAGRLFHNCLLRVQDHC